MRSASSTRRRRSSRAHLADHQPVAHVVRDVHVREQGVVLEHGVDVPFVGRQPRHVRAVEEHPTLGRQLEARDHAQGRGLARTGRPEHREELAGRDVEVDARHRHHLAVQLADGLEPHRGTGGRRRGRRRWLAGWRPSRAPRDRGHSLGRPDGRSAMLGGGRVACRSGPCQAPAADSPARGPTVGAMSARPTRSRPRAPSVAGAPDRGGRVLRGGDHAGAHRCPAVGRAGAIASRVDRPGDAGTAPTGHGHHARLPVRPDARWCWCRGDHPAHGVQTRA